MGTTPTTTSSGRPGSTGTPPAATLAMTGTQLRVLAGQVGPGLDAVRLRLVPVVVDTRARVGATVGVRVLPAVRDAGQRLQPVAARAAVRAGDTLRAATTAVVDRGRPVAREAARRGLNTWAAVLGGQPVSVPVPAHRQRRAARRVLTVAAFTGVAYGAWQTLRRAENPWQDSPDLTPGPDQSPGGALDLPVAGGPVGPAIVDFEPVVPDPAGSVSPPASVPPDPVTDATQDPAAPAPAPTEPPPDHIPTDRL